MPEYLKKQNLQSRGVVAGITGTNYEIKYQ